MDVAAETHFLYTKTSANDVETRCRMLSRNFYRSFQDKLTHTLAALAIPAFAEAVEAGSPADGITFASVVPLCFRQTSDIIKENVLSAAIAPHFSGGSIVKLTAGICGLPLFAQYFQFDEVHPRDFGDLPVQHIAVITYGNMLQQLEHAALIKLLPAIRGNSYAGSAYEECMKWTKKDISEDVRNQMSSILCLPLFDF